MTNEFDSQKTKQQDSPEKDNILINNSLISKEDNMKKDSVQKVIQGTHQATLIIEDAEHRFVTDEEKEKWNNKADNSVATKKAPGLMSIEDKTKIDGLDSQFKTRDDKISKNSTAIQSLTNDIEDTLNEIKYLGYKSSNISISNCLEGRTSNMKLKGRTILNISPKGVDDCSDVSAFNHNYEVVNVEQGEGFITCTQEESGKYGILGYNNDNLLKTNSYYLHIVKVEVVENPDDEDCLIHLGSGETIKQQTIKSGTGIIAVTCKTPEEMNGTNDKWIGVRIGAFDTKTGGKSFKAYSFASYEITEEESKKELNELLKIYPVKCRGLKSTAEEELNKITYRSNNSNLCSDIIVGGILLADFSDYSNNQYLRTNYINVAGMTSLSRYLNNYTEDINPSAWYFYDYNMQPIKPAMYGDKVVVPKNATYMRMEFSSKKKVDISSFADKLQFTICEKSTPLNYYIPYAEDKKSIQLKEPLRAIGDLKDILVEENSKIYVYRNIAMYSFTGTENINLSGNQPTDDKYIRFYIEGIKGIKLHSGINVLCSHLPAVDLGPKPNAEGIFVSNTVDIQILKSRLSKEDVDGFKKWLTDNSVALYAPKDSVVKEEIKTVKDLNLDTYYNKSYFSIDNEVPCVMDFKMPSNIAAVIQNTAKEVNDLLDKTVSSSESQAILTEGFISKPRILANYVHNSNKVIIPTNLDLDTGVYTTAEPHGLQEGDKLLPNFFIKEAYPDGKIEETPKELWNFDFTTWYFPTVVVVDETKFKLNNNRDDSPITYDRGNNAKLKCGNWGFEKPSGTISFSNANFDKYKKLRFVINSYNYCNAYSSTLFVKIFNKDVPLRIDNKLKMPYVWQGYDEFTPKDFSIQKFRNESIDMTLTIEDNRVYQRANRSIMGIKDALHYNHGQNTDSPLSDSICIVSDEISGIKFNESIQLCDLNYKYLNGTTIKIYGEELLDNE